MKLSINSKRCALAAILAVTALSVLPVKAAQTNQFTSRSVFTMPANPKQGHDPFFPYSTRPYQTGQSDNSAPVVTSTLTVRGITYDGTNSVATIGMHTYMIGQECMEGSLHVRCLDIEPDSVVVEVNGQRQELHLSTSP